MNCKREFAKAIRSKAFLCGEANISQNLIENQAAYIQGWLKKFKDDKKMVVMAAAQAHVRGSKTSSHVGGTLFRQQKAADYVLNREVEG